MVPIKREKNLSCEIIPGKIYDFVKIESLGFKIDFLHTFFKISICFISE